MTEKQVRNKFRDVISDYYRTNRQVEKDNPSKKGGPWTPIEKSMLIVTVALVIAVIIKYFVL